MAEIVPSAGRVEGKRSWRGFWRTGLLALGLIVVAGAAGMGLRWLQSRGEAPAEPLAKLPVVVNDVQNLRLSGDADAADEKIQAALDDPSLDNKTRYDLYLQQGHSFADKKDYENAIKSYKEAEKNDPTHSVAWLLGDTYRNTGETQQAIDYYNTAITRLPADDPLSDADRQYLQQIVKDLEAQQS